MTESRGGRAKVEWGKKKKRKKTFLWKRETLEPNWCLGQGKCVVRREELPSCVLPISGLRWDLGGGCKELGLESLAETVAGG